jgi:uncharacterized protein (DUF433 family)
MPALTDIGQLITSHPEVCGGRHCIAGSRITVQYIMTEIKAGQLPEEILEDKPYLSLASIHAAIAHYYVNKLALDTAFAADDAAAQLLAQKMIAILDRAAGPWAIENRG